MSYYFKAKQVNSLKLEVTGLSAEIKRLKEKHAKELADAKEIGVASGARTPVETPKLPEDSIINETSTSAKAQERLPEDPNALRLNATELKAREAVKARLFDPDSTQFKIMKVGISSAPGQDFVCGEYNAKNRAGGYDGFRRFYWSSGQIGAVVDVAAQSSDLRFVGAWKRDCAGV